MAENRKILLYRIDEQAKNVIFVVTEDDPELWGNISEDMQTVLSFDEVFRDITEFRNGFLDYEQLTDELIGAINGRGAVFREILERFDDNRLNSFNFFTRYYSDTLRDIFLSARADIDKAGAFFNTRALKKSTEYVNEVFNNIREVMRDDWNFDFNSESDMKAFRLSFDKIIIRGNDRNDIYTVADTALVNFFYDFSFAIHSRKLYVCSCKYCGKVFLGKKNAVCCDGEECQVAYQHDKKNEKRRAKSKDTYNEHMTKLTTYLSQHTSGLKAAVQEDMRYVNKFKSRNAEFKAGMKAEIDRCQAENIIPGDEQTALLRKLEAEIVVYQSQIEAEWRAEQEKKK